MSLHTVQQRKALGHLGLSLRRLEAPELTESLCAVVVVGVVVVAVVAVVVVAGGRGVEVVLCASKRKPSQYRGLNN